MAGWLDRLGRRISSGSSSVPGDQEGDEPERRRITGSTPGIAALLEAVEADGSHSILDLGPAMASSFQLYRRFAHRIRFADLFGEWTKEGWKTALASIPQQARGSYDLILAWDMLDRLSPDGRRELIDTLAGLSAPGAGFHTVIHDSGVETIRPLQFGLLDVDRMYYEPSSSIRLSRTPILPAELARLVEPFRVTRAFTLKGDLREYVAIRS